MAGRFLYKTVGAVMVMGIALSGGCGKQSEPDYTQEIAGSSLEQSIGQDAQMGENMRYTEQEIWCRRDDNSIYGKAYIPEGGGTFPLVIFAHELGNNHTTGIEYAKRLAAEGFAVYTFDFCGGSVSYMENRSDGKNTEMSVMTEASDLEAVMEAAGGWDFVDKDRIILMGGSQGGAVAAIVAARNPELVSQLILLYPALLVQDNVLEMFDSKEAVPEEYNLFGGWIRVGRNYAVDVWDYDVYSELPKYTGSVLLLHGDKDDTVPLGYSERASKVYEDCEFHIIKDGGHEFFGQAFEDAVQILLEYLEK